MKKIGLFVTMSFFIVTASIFATSNDVKVVPPTNDEDALYCHVYKGGNEATCWFCSCSELAKTL